MKKIHPTALIEDGAQIADDVEIGAYATVGANVIIGSGCRIRSHAILTGYTSLGENNQIGHGAIIGAEPQDFAFDPSTHSEVQIGSHNIIREYVTIHRGTKAGSVTKVGDHNFLMTGCHLGHNAEVKNHVIIANNCLLAGYVEVQDHAVLGGGTVFHQFMRVGRNTMVRGGTRFGKDIPPFTIGYTENTVVGINAIGLRRGGFKTEARLELKRAFKLIYKSGMNVSQALIAAREETWGPEAQEFFAFIEAAKKRGICDANYRDKAGPTEFDGDV